MSGTRLVLATGNRGKIREIKNLLADLPVEILTQHDFDAWPELEEPWDTFEENAAAKARKLAEWAGMAALADDSGLEVEALRGAPGAISARYAGRQGDDVANVAKLLGEMEGIPVGGRGARFVCVLVLASPQGDTVEIRDTCEGTITAAPRGEKGFGYDPVFVAVGQDRTMAELPLDEKNAISHRGKALRHLREMIGQGKPEWFFGQADAR